MTGADWTRVRALIDRYQDLRLGGTDAGLIAIAERLGVTRVATLDHRHFRVVRPAHCEAPHNPSVIFCSGHRQIHLTQPGVTLVTALVSFGTAVYHHVPLCTSAYHDLFDLRVLVVAVRTTEV